MPVSRSLMMFSGRSWFLFFGVRQETEVHRDSSRKGFEEQTPLQQEKESPHAAVGQGLRETQPPSCCLESCMNEVGRVCGTILHFSIAILRWVCCVSICVKRYMHMTYTYPYMHCRTFMTKWIHKYRLRKKNIIERHTYIQSCMHAQMKHVKHMHPSIYPSIHPSIHRRIKQGHMGLTSSTTMLVKHNGHCNWPNAVRCSGYMIGVNVKSYCRHARPLSTRNCVYNCMRMHNRTALNIQNKINVMKGQSNFPNGCFPRQGIVKPRCHGVSLIIETILMFCCNLGNMNMPCARGTYIPTKLTCVVWRETTRVSCVFRVYWKPVLLDSPLN